MNNDWVKNAIFTDPLEDFRTNFFNKLDSEKKQKEIELKRVQKNCWHKYTKFLKYNDSFTIAMCEICNHAKFCKN
jgi:hypothetical protein